MHEGADRLKSQTEGERLDREKNHNLHAVLFLLLTYFFILLSALLLLFYPSVRTYSYL